MPTTAAVALGVVRHSIEVSRRSDMRSGAARFVRTIGLIQQSNDVTALESNPVFRRHVLPRATDDPYFYAVGDYLFRNLDRRRRARTILHHHHTESSTFDADFLDEVYGPGVELWHLSAERPGDHGIEHFSMRLSSARHYLYEGALSLTLYVDGRDIRVLSFSFVDGSIVPNEDLAVLITRHQHWRSDEDPDASPCALVPGTDAHSTASTLGSSLLTSNSAMHLCVAAMSGVALAMGLGSLHGLDERVHLADAGQGNALAPSYSACWQTFNARQFDDVSFEIPLPLDSTPIGEVSAKKRRRARKRRQLWDDIALDVFNTVNAARLTPLEPPTFPPR